jgi:hypothetical protein
MAETRYTIRSEYTGAWAALSLGVALLRKSKANTWSEMTEKLEDPESLVSVNLSKVVLSDEQIALLDTNDEVLQYLKNDPSVQVALCGCGLPYLVAGKTATAAAATAPKTCLADPRCESVPVKPAAATISKPAPAAAK